LSRRSKVPSITNQIKRVESCETICQYWIHSFNQSIIYLFIHESCCILSGSGHVGNGDNVFGFSHDSSSSPPPSSASASANKFRSKHCYIRSINDNGNGNGHECHLDTSRIRCGWRSSERSIRIRSRIIRR